MYLLGLYVNTGSPAEFLNVDPTHEFLLGFIYLLQDLGLEICHHLLVPLDAVLAVAKHFLFLDIVQLSNIF